METEIPSEERGLRPTWLTVWLVTALVTCVGLTIAHCWLMPEMATEADRSKPCPSSPTVAVLMASVAASLLGNLAAVVALKARRQAAAWLAFVPVIPFAVSGQMAGMFFGVVGAGLAGGALGSLIGACTGALVPYALVWVFCRL